ncbi:MAG: hypothetical protein N3F64_06100 [Nitrososphaeria archaeon]|nr:hypothetical protein [Nitrososphaeria archaeon]
MNIITTVSGIHSRSENLIKMTREFDKGIISYNELRKALINDIKNFIGVQSKAGLEVFSDGMLNWQDPIRPIIECVEGIKGGPYLRWFETNTFYKKPMVVDTLKIKKETVKKFFNFDLVPEEKSKIAILPGPYTLSILSNEKNIERFTNILKDIIKLLKKDYKNLFILLQEPCLVYEQYFPNKEYFIHLKKAYNQLYSDNPQKYIIHTFFGNAENIGPLLYELECWIGIDMTETPYSILKNFKKSNILLGILDSQNPIIEASKRINKLIEYIKSLEIGKVGFCPNTDLRYLPRKLADKKIITLKKVKCLLVS